MQRERLDHLLGERATKLDELQKLVDKAEIESRDLNRMEERHFTRLKSELAAIDERILNEKEQRRAEGFDPDRKLDGRMLQSDGKRR